MDAEAAIARDAYPDLLVAGPQFGIGREREQGGWEILIFPNDFPQQARDDLGHVLRVRADEMEQAGDDARHGEYLAAIELVDWEPVNDVTAGGERYRIVRADMSIRSGPRGLEPPRPSDLDPTSDPGEHYPKDPARGFVVDTGIATTAAAGMLTVDLLSSVYHARVPPEVRRDSEQARHTHPGGVLLPAAFIVAEHTDGNWSPALGGTCPTPHSARRSLAFHLRVTIPFELRLDEDRRAVYTAAADRLEESSASDLEIEGRQFRIARVERLMRVGPDGPEGPRASDYDPDLPPKLWEQQQREQGLLPEDENAPIVNEKDEDHQRFIRLLEEEGNRRRSRRGNADTG